jgi:hypothetical protein
MLGTSSAGTRIGLLSAMRDLDWSHCETLTLWCRRGRSKPNELADPMARDRAAQRCRESTKVPVLGFKRSIEGTV